MPTIVALSPLKHTTHQRHRGSSQEKKSAKRKNPPREHSDYNLDVFIKIVSEFSLEEGDIREDIHLQHSILRGPTPF